MTLYPDKLEWRNRTTCIRQAVASLLLTALAVRAWGDRPVVQATKALQPPMIDGRLDDACWMNARPVTEFLINNGNKPATFPSRAMVVYNDEALYIAVRCEEPNVKNLQTRPLPRDHSDVFRTDCIEIMLDPGRSQSDYYHLGVNASGSIADRACTQGGHIGDMSWDAEVTAASFVGDTYWSCEVAIPFFGLGLSSKVGATWGLNICREKKQPAEDSSVAEQGAFNIASRFAELRGLEADLSRYCHQLGPVKTQQVLKEGKLEVSLGVSLLNGTGKDAQVLLDGWLVSPTGKVTLAKSTATPPRDKEYPVTLGPFSLEEQGDYTCHVRVADPITKKPLAVRKSILPVRYVPVTIDLIEPWYRDSIFTTQQMKKVVLEVGVNLSAAELQGTSLAVRISETGSSKALARNLVTSVKQKNRLTFDAVALPETKMDLVASLEDKTGKIVASTSHPLRKLPHQPGEVWLGKDLNWHVDGKPFFLNGAWNYPEDFVPDYDAFSHDKPGDVKLLDTSIMNEVYYKVKSLRAESLSEEDAGFCRAYARNARKNQKLFGYYVSDEPEGNNFKAKVLEQIYQVFADEDPYHPVIISNDSMEGMHAYARCADINGLHPYPVILKDKPANDLGSVAAFTEGAVRAFEGSAHKQTIAYLHQGFNYGDYGAVNNRIPSYTEYRNQNLLALICGANGIIQFNRMVAHYPELSLGMPHLTKELAHLGQIVLSPTSPLKPTANTDKVKMLLKDHKGSLCLLVCNADTNARDVSFTVPGLSKLSNQLHVLSEGRSVSLQGDGWTDHFEPYEVHVYTTGKAPDLPTVKEIVAQINRTNEQRRKPGNLAFQMFEGDGVVVTASSNKAGQYRRPDNGLWHVVDGVVDRIDHYHCLTWQDKTDNELPDWLEIRLPQFHRIGRVVVYPFEQSLKDYSVQAWVNGEWREVDKVAGQKSEQITHTFEPVTTDRIRLLVTATNEGNSKVTEVEVYEH